MLLLWSVTEITYLRRGWSISRPAISEGNLWWKSHNFYSSTAYVSSNEKRLEEEKEERCLCIVATFSGFPALRHVTFPRTRVPKQIKQIPPPSEIETESLAKFLRFRDRITRKILLLRTGLGLDLLFLSSRRFVVVERWTTLGIARCLNCYRMVVL